MIARTYPEKSKIEQIFETLISSLDNSWMPNNKPMNKPPTQYQPKSTNFDERMFSALCIHLMLHQVALRDAETRLK